MDVVNCYRIVLVGAIMKALDVGRLLRMTMSSKSKWE